ncbi:AraC family transcriptional regulator [Pseudomonas sp. G34]|uniref:helix-turn-helix domain-containing protein n=1 Tax=Pseudomonas sp. G34 TaxID=3059083 RepID=UPI002809BBCD|nr:AraC family transcriptional regulator [Pseudomonas sp. G34]MDQ7987377.1 AraC family transcriptional regulator [Pseudomonas sp. G34]
MEPDYALFKGLSGHATQHRHYAHQCISVLQVDQAGSWRWIESMQAHEADMPGAVVLAVYAEPLSFSLCSLHALAEVASALLPGLAKAMQAIARQPIPERLQAALLRMDEQLQGKVSAADLACNVHTSQSHLQRLFDSRLGLSIRRMVLWRRLRLALRLAIQGHSLTEAAHASGFADSAHLSRTLRGMFGISGRQNLRHLSLRLLPLAHPDGVAEVDPLA